MSPIACLILFALTSAASLGAWAQPWSDKAPPGIQQKLAAGEVVEVIVLFEHDGVDREARIMRERAGLLHDDERVLAFKQEAHRAIKLKALQALRNDEREIMHEYDRLPMMALRLRSANALQRLLMRPDVVAVYPDKRYHPILNESLPLIHQPRAVAAGQSGAGTTIAVLDSGVDYTRAAFGSCSSPGVPAACKVAVSVDIAANDNALDDNGHGTHVSGIASGVAPGAKLAVLDVFVGNTASSMDIINAINWTLANRSTYNIVALNMSFSDGVKYTAPCSQKFGPTGNEFRQPIIDARAAGMLSVAASGNDGYTDGLANPACTPEAISVGAVYDSNNGGLNWGTCTDSSTAADKVACFSNTASFLSLLAPGALITAAGTNAGGTSMAAPHAAGAVAVLRAAFPGESVSDTQQRLINGGLPVTDARQPAIVKPRIDLASTFPAPANDAYADAIALTGSSGTVNGNSTYASKESGEPYHAGSTGGASVWWTWTAPANGQVSFDTQGSGFDTLLGVYTGNAVSALSLVAANDDIAPAQPQSQVAFSATAGVSYRIAVDGKNAESGAIVVNWTLTPAPDEADLNLGLTAAPSSVTVGEHITYTATVDNLGPSPAQGVTLHDSLPAGVTFVSADPGCTLDQGVVTCILGDLASGTSISRSVMLRADATGTLTNGFQVTSTTADANNANNSAEVAVTVSGPSADVSLALSAAPESTVVGGQVSYSLTVGNSGPSSAQNAVLTATLPTSANLIGASAECAPPSSGQVICALGTLAPGGSYTGFIDVQYISAGSFSLNTSIGSDTADPNPGNNAAMQSTTVSEAQSVAVPALPLWGELILGGWLLRRVLVHRRPAR